MKLLRYIRAYVGIYLQFFDHRCACRAGELAAKGRWRNTR